MYCDEPVLAGEQHCDYAQPMHVECGIRAAVGSVAHQEHKCSCYIRGALDPEGPALTVREHARAAAAWFQSHAYPN